MQLEIEGTDLPGRTFRNAAVPVYDVHVGVQLGKEPTQLVPADAARAEWVIEVRVKQTAAGWDFAGPAVHGRRGERFVYLTWGNVGPGGFELIRRLKIRLGSLDPEMVAAAELGGSPIRLRIALTDRHGGPLCGSLDASSVLAGL